MKQHIERYRKHINPPYTKSDLPTIIVTILILFVPLLILLSRTGVFILGNAVSPNLLQNSSFEQTTQLGFPANWQPRPSGKWDNTVARTGNASLKVTGPVGYSYTFAAPTLKPSTTYTMSVWVKAQNVTTRWGVSMRYPVTKVTVDNSNLGSVVTGTTDWTQVSKTFTTLPDYQAGRLDLTYELNDGAVAWFDDAVICEGTSVDCVISVQEPTVTPTLEPTVTIAPSSSPSAATFTPTATMTPTATPTPTNGPMPLLSSYIMKKDTGGNVPYGGSLYFPRKFKVGTGIPGLNITDPGAFSGWDLYSGVPALSSLAETVTLYLNRSATLAVVWRENPDLPIPQWLASWSKAGTVTTPPSPYTYTPNQGTFAVYKKNFPAGKVTLGGIVDPGKTFCNSGCNYTPQQRRGYFVLLAEQDGNPTEVPSVPAGKTVPVANAVCPTWVHDQYKTVGPDGKMYATWHNIVDPVYWCTFGHEHGADPKLLSKDYISVFEYTAQKHGMTEGHPGFKNLVLNSGGYRWFIMAHLGTSGRARLCNSFHTVEIAAVNPTTGEKVVDLRFMGNFGPAVSNAGGDQPIRPAECPNQYEKAVTYGGGGVRKIPVESISGRVTGYEPWRLGIGKLVLGLDSIFLINQYDTITGCNDLQCATLIKTASSGTNRFYQGATFGITAGSKGKNTGTFCTDPMGEKFLSCDDPMAIKQYIKPGFSGKITSNGTMDHESFGRVWLNSRNAQPANRENAVTTAPN